MRESKEFMQNKKNKKARLRVARMCADSIKTRVKLGASKCKARKFRAKIKINHAQLRIAQNVRGFNTKNGKMMVHEFVKVRNSSKIKKKRQARLRVARMCADSIQTKIK